MHCSNFPCWSTESSDWFINFCPPGQKFQTTDHQHRQGQHKTGSTVRDCWNKHGFVHQLSGLDGSCGKDCHTSVWYILERFSNRDCRSKTKFLPRAITSGANSGMNRLEFLEIARNLVKGREKARVKRCHSFWFCSSLAENVAWDNLASH